MIQENLKNKDKDLKGMKKALEKMLDRSWEKGYIAGFNDGYATRREADKALKNERPQGEWICNPTYCYKCNQANCNAVRWTDKLSIDADGNIRDFNGRVLFIHPTYNMDEYGDEGGRQ